MNSLVLLVSLSLLVTFTNAQDITCDGNTYLDVSENMCRDLPDNYTYIFNATEYSVAVFQKDATEDSTLLYFKIFIEANLVTDIGILILVSDTHPFLIGSSGSLNRLYSINNVGEVQIIEDTIVAGNDLEVGVHTFALTARVVISGVVQEEVVNVTINVKADFDCSSVDCNGGTCIPEGDSFTCLCPEGFTGTNCEIEMDPCDSNPCENGGTCIKLSPTIFNCVCAPGYTGNNNCSVNINDCAGIDCGNGTCRDLVNGYECTCDAGYTGDDCMVNINDCDPDPCVNGTCEDLVDDYLCNCFLDWTGKDCDSPINSCDFSNFPCDIIGFQGCIDGNNTFECICRIGFTGFNCSTNINECDPNPCQNNGNCTDLIGTYSCNCPFGYGGIDCEDVVDFCIEYDNPCVYGTCQNIEAVGYECLCNPGYTGMNCSIDIDECDPNPCMNDATCNDMIADYSCICPFDYTGKECEDMIDSCDDLPCAEGATCIDGLGTFTCVCPPDYTNVRCNESIDNCINHTCDNGLCIDDIETFTCDCFNGYTGILCDEDISVCETEFPCENGGTCSDGTGLDYECFCLPGFTDNNCTVDISVCEESPCENGGSCEDGIGLDYTCFCTDGFDGPDCTIDVNICDESNPCQNGGTCEDGIGLDYTCICAAGFDGPNCTIDVSICQESSPCQNGGTCEDGTGLDYTCVCTDGFDGPDCTIDVSVCDDSSPCQNGGTCEDGIGLVYTCICVAGFDGTNCTIDVSVCGESSPCQNGGTCEDGIRLDYTCICAAGFSGTNCTIDVSICEESSPCQNGGTCEDGIGLDYTCICAAGFSGTNCTIDVSVCEESSPCQNGGTCEDGTGLDYTCFCAAGFDGSNCNIDEEFCTPDSCLNGGTCIEGYGTKTSCACPVDFGGPQCGMELIFCVDNYCLNGGSCIDLEGGSGTICLCPYGFSGDMCEVDVPVCNDTPPDKCFNGGECIDGFGPAYSCSCTAGFDGDDCSIDLDFCTNTYCDNDGDCIEGYGEAVSCNCSVGFSGDQCQMDLDFCANIYCENNGTCIEGYGPEVTCNCTDTFTGTLCDTAFCPDGYCFNEGNCSVNDVLNLVECSCPPGYYGDRCENDVDVCDGDTCSNGGTCMEGDGLDFTCKCQDGFSGQTCNIDEDVCDTPPLKCVNGECIEGYGNTYSCNCSAGFSGDNCTNDLDHCYDEYCINGGTCIEGVGEYISCVCLEGFTGDRCEINIDYCTDTSCMNGGTCVDEFGGIGIMCICLNTFTGDICETAFCPDGYCENNGNCSVNGNEVECSCIPGCGGDQCETDPDVCDSETCSNGGSCIEGLCLDYTCVCPPAYTGTFCDTPLCMPDTCMNGGTCSVEGTMVVCNCPNGFSGDNCENTTNDCRSNADCPASTFCKIECSSDDYPSHTALLSEAVTLEGVSFVSVDETKYPTFSGQLSLFAVFRQEMANRGYLIFYGTSGNTRNFAVFLDNNSNVTTLWFYYTTSSGDQKSIHLSLVLGKWKHYFALTINAGYANFYINGSLIESGVQSLEDPDFNYGVSADSPANLFIGARLPRHFRFIGTIYQVMFFQELIAQTFIQQLQSDFSSLVDPVGECALYIQNGGSCPEPSIAPSTLCTSSVDLCDTALRCLPNIDGSYNCRPQPLSCSSDDDCSPNYFCGSELPGDGTNYFENPSSSLPGEGMFLQEPALILDGESIVSLSATQHPDLASDISIFAVVQQEPGNDGYVVGKGVNDRLRDFGLYLRSSRKTIWLAYGANSQGEGFREILFFYNVSVADGNRHSIAAVVDSSANRAVLYIDGEVAGQHTPLPSLPTFRPGFNILYVGGRPGTKLFRLRGTVENLIVITAPIQEDIIMNLHRQGLDGTVTLEPPTSHYCYQYKSVGEACIVGDEDLNDNDFRCLYPARCVSEFRSTTVRELPKISTPFRERGVCISACDCTDDVDKQCGLDGNTYLNECYRICAEIPKFHDGECEDYALLYAQVNGTQTE